MSTRVVNIRDLPTDRRLWPPDHVYVGRSAWLGRTRLARSAWRNPFADGRDGTREEVVAKFERYVTRQPDLMARLGELTGKTLVCWCAPAACHGDVLARLADEVAE